MVYQANAAIDIRNNVWLLHPLVTGSVYIVEKVLEIESFAKQGDWRNAALLQKNGYR